MNLFEALRQDHDTQRTLLELLVKTHGDSEGREELFAKVKQELTAHAAAEERALYVPMMEQDLTQEKARHSVAEHHEIDELVEELENTDFSSPGWLATAKKLQHLVTHHLDEEEQEVFQLAGRALNEQDKTRLAGTYREEMAAAK
ncbi:MAG: hemerythrin domain-containing protein [Alcanivorax sp.]|uniref:Hemerythrin domain-containing protein n=1 Tax=Alloalcanivorax marinus TaxID=1177169 RepID=A0A9Q3UPP8_9GAMM|nr:hemerythrin domain-containing protein [Alloalcanivorax marinus]MBM7332096.1 hemerythrin domain-containing protein [Alloalcanivorax marinus]MCC4309821.1 hemerythrin domain-containing protein [Alloalcanivorax marinus]